MIVEDISLDSEEKTSYGPYVYSLSIQGRVIIYIYNYTYMFIKRDDLWLGMIRLTVNYSPALFLMGPEVGLSETANLHFFLSGKILHWLLDPEKFVLW